MQCTCFPPKNLWGSSKEIGKVVSSKELSGLEMLADSFNDDNGDVGNEAEGSALSLVDEASSFSGKLKALLSITP